MINLKLKGKVALVTGSTAGIGFAIARSLVNEGVSVYVNGRSRERVDHAINQILNDVPSSRIEGIVADFSTKDGAAAVIAEVPEIDILVNNVGIFEPKPFIEIPDADWYRFYEVNVLSGVRLSRHYFAGNAEKELGAHHFHLQRVGSPDTARDGSLRHDENSPGRDRSRNCRVGGWDRCDRE